MLVREIHKSIMVRLTMFNLVFRKALAIANSLTADYNCLVTAWCKPYTKSLPPPPLPDPKKTLELQMLPPGLALNFAWFFPLKALQRLGGECGWRPVVYLHNHYFMKILFSSKNFSVRCFIKHCKRRNRPKALSTLTHSTPFVQSRSFNKLWNLGLFGKGREI